MAAKIAGLLKWCKIQCEGYKNVTITNFTTSWKSGLAFCAIIHRYRPDLIDYDSLLPNDTYGNSKLAFDVALSLGIPALLDPEDMVVMTVPDKLCIITYVSQYCNFFQNKPKDGGPSIKTATKRSSNYQEVQPPEKKLFAVNANIQANKRGTLEDKCVECRKKVYLLERHIDNGKLYHRHCFRELDRISTLEKNKGTEKLLAASYSIPVRKTVASANNVPNKHLITSNNNQPVPNKHLITSNNNQPVPNKLLITSNNNQPVSNKHLISTNNNQLITNKNQPVSNNIQLVSNKSPTPFNSNHLISNKQSNNVMAPSSSSYSNVSKSNLAKESIVQKTHAAPTPLINNTNVSSVKMSLIGDSTKLQVYGNKQDLKKPQPGSNVQYEIKLPVDQRQNVSSTTKTTTTTANNTLTTTTTTTASPLLQTTISSKNASSKLSDLIMKFESPSSKSDIKTTDTTSFSVTKFSANIPSPSSRLTTTTTSSTPSKSITPPSQPITSPSKSITPPSVPIISPSKSITSPSQPITSPSKSITPPSVPITSPSKSITVPTTSTTSSLLPPTTVHSKLPPTITTPPRKPTSNDSNISKIELQITGPEKEPKEIITIPIRIADGNKTETTLLVDKKASPVPKAKESRSKMESSSEDGEIETEDIERSLNQPDLNDWKNSAKAGVFQGNVSSDKIEKVVGVYNEDVNIKKCEDLKRKFWWHKNKVTMRRVSAEASPSKEEIVVMLKKLDGKLVEVEEEGRKLEEMIRSCSEEKMEEEEELMKKWLQLVKKRSDLIREESDLIYQKQQQILEKQHEELEYQFRFLSSIPENEKNEEEKKIEAQLVQKILKIVNFRNEIVDSIECDRIRYKVEDEQFDNEFYKLSKNSKKKKIKSKFSIKNSSNNSKRNKKTSDKSVQLAA